MEPFTQLSGIAVPLPIDNLDTDQLMPKQFLRSIDKSGLARGLLFDNAGTRPHQHRENAETSWVKTKRFALAFN